uniref:ATP-binding cassette sub-family D member 3-like n=1 Tax=Sinocyclocheilus grahami TaxID=75366 RepID=A0A672SFK0_SINGR
MAAVSKYLTAGNSSIADHCFLCLKTDKAAVDKVFFRRICHIMKILLPQTFCKESGYLLLIAAMLMARTYSYLFLCVMTCQISLVNNLLKLGLNELKLCFRMRLTNHLYNDYLTGFTYYQIGNLDNRIANPDQLITQDVEKFCNSVVDLYSNVSKPLLDILIYICKLNTAIGSLGPASLLSYLVFSGLLLTRLRRPIGKMTITEQRYEGEYRYVNSRLITNSEEIAFYNGNRREKQTINGTFQKLVRKIKIRHVNSTYSERLEDYYQSGRMLISLAQALGRIVLAGREMTRLSGFTARITDIQEVLKELNSGRYERTMVTQIIKDDSVEKIPLIPGKGKIIIADNIIKFEHIPLVTPNGDILIRDLSFEVSSGTNVLVCGPNGCGKSSLFRVLGELWPLCGGQLTKPQRGKLFYVPQRPYMTLGSLRDQVIYPDTHEDQKKEGTSDRVLKEYLDNVQLGHILEREGSWDIVQDWMDVLSGGEKQRMAMARLFYHKPQFAILDECTSAVSVDVEDFIYSHCRKVGITLFTVSHRKSLWKHHEYYLHMDGRGNYEFKPITKETVEFGS